MADVFSSNYSPLLFTVLPMIQMEKIQNTAGTVVFQLLSDTKQMKGNKIRQVAGYKIKNVAGIIKSIAIGTRCNNGRSPKCLQSYNWQKRGNQFRAAKVCLIPRNLRENSRKRKQTGRD